MIILGIDPGYDRVGVAVLDLSFGVGREKLIYSSCIETDPKDTLSARLLVIYTSISEVIREFKPTSLAIEKIFITKNQKTAMQVAEAKGVIMLASEKAGLAVFEYSPPEIKMAVTGYGNSSKSQVEEMVKKLIEFGKENTKDDELDAIAIGLTHSALLARHSIEN